MGRKLERFKQHLGLEHETKGFAAERTQRLGDAVAARVERARVIGAPAPPADPPAGQEAPPA